MKQNGLSLYTSPLEQRIAKHLVDEILKRGYMVRVWDGEGWAHKEYTSERRVILDAMASTGIDSLRLSQTDPVWGKRRIGGITLIYGNDRDLISDWTDRPEIDEIANAVNDWIDRTVRA